MHEELIVVKLYNACSIRVHGKNSVYKVPINVALNTPINVALNIPINVALNIPITVSSKMW